jgi:amino-acid N-acetyltransferase
VTGPTRELTLREPDADGVAAVRDLLAANDLPHDAVAQRDVRFVAGFVDDELVAAGGIEQYGTAALLRSVVVADAHRGQGYATAVCDELETVATDSGVEALYLLTTTAAAFFEGREFTAIERDAAPSRVQHSREFAEQCPTSATCMRKPLRAAE